MTLPLTGVKVLDFSEHGFVPAAAAALADFGADVVKIERVEGDAMRSIIPSGMVPSKDGYDFLFELVNRNKRGIALDVRHTEGRRIFEKLVKWADVAITNQLPRVQRKLHTEPSDLLALNPRLVVAKGHGQGQRGPEAEAGGYDAVSYWARGGVAHVLTDEGAARPAQQRPAIGDIPSGMFLAGGICAALVHVSRTGEGTVVDTSLLGSAAWNLGPDMAYASLTGEQLPKAPLKDMAPLIRQYRSADDRWVALMMIDEARYWEPALVALGLDALVDAYPDAAARKENRESIAVQIGAVIAGLDSAAITERLGSRQCIFSFYSTPVDVQTDTAVTANGYLMRHPEHPDLKLSAAPVQFDDEMPSIRRAAPSKGQHTREVLSEIGYSAEEIVAMLDSEVVVE
ncbi:CoA transferase (plasmid) [Rhodococcus erythropolis]|uniref:CaiB/BaiF CoA transferase family protein n=1 Tax=Rhodococcus TaxID=1827 RepID=UPI0009356B0E|nr:MULTISPECIES: CoA transferase [Rhodococcus]MCJ0949792.1 CoA transferase [Rhodococcus sp. ARC_M8]MCZ4547285.1 CoA transferase [Rhodococcus qingshengii]MDJ0441057.1 CoA transferase [Rhodococcus qingshengii]OKA12541.1 CoA transferase [Rhodococcus erythropolis]QEX08333.1 CoA transferase [Rhodococcus erythropolis]